MPFFQVPSSTGLRLAMLAQQRPAQRVVDRGLVALPLAFRERTCRLDDDVVEHDGDTGLAFAGGDCPTTGMAEVVLVFHGSSLQILCWLRSSPCDTEFRMAWLCMLYMYMEGGDHYRWSP